VSIREEGYEDTLEYLDQPYKDTFESGAPIARDGWNRSHGGKLPLFYDKVLEPQDVREDLMKSKGVDYPILNNFISLDMIPHPELSIELAKAMNDRLLEKFLDGNEDFTGLCSVSMHKPDKAAEEIDRMGSEKQIEGIYIQMGGHDRALGHPRHDKIYRAAEDNDLSITYHSSSAIGVHEVPFFRRGYEKFLPVYAASHPMVHTFTVASLISQGVPEKFPDLDFVFSEAGLSWFANIMSRLNKGYDMRREDAPLLTKPPEEYMRESFYAGTQPMDKFQDPEHLIKMIDIVGPESIIFSSDHPHYDHDHPAIMNETLRRIPDEDRDKILYKNAAEVYNINL
jgi:predicted TIM-barrel fold metal-dependent hydrolase